MEIQEMPLTSYGMMAERHWRQHLPKLVAELEEKGELHNTLVEAQERTIEEMEKMRQDLLEGGMTSYQQVHDVAWEVVKKRYIFIQAEAEN